MSTILVDGGLLYTIPADCVDLKYLSKYGSSSTETPCSRVPRWTNERLDGETGYFQLQILTRDEECYSEPTDTYECHICNVNVPVTCYKEHNESDQHETFKNIYQKVLEKLSKQIDMSIVKHDEEKDKDTYYCVPCSKIIKKESKDKHESTDFHAKSYKDTIIISEFYKIIKENRRNADNIILIEERLGQDRRLVPDNTTSCVENDCYATTNNKFNNYGDADDDESIDLPTYANELAVPGASKNYRNIHFPNDDEAETFEEYLKAMIEKYKLNVNLPMIVSEEIWIESSKGDIVKVSKEHFQSYKHMKNSIYCQICKTLISQDTRPHDATEHHVRNIFKPIDENFARTIDSVSSQCVPCNDVVLTNSVQHMLDDHHKKIVKDTRLKKIGQTYCEDCNLYIYNYNFSVHIMSKKHLIAIMRQNSMNKTEDPDNFFCKLCNLTVSRNRISNHVVTEMHLTRKTNDSAKINNKTQNTDKRTKPAKINDSPATVTEINNLKYCKICQVEVPNGGMDIHIDGKAHKKQISELNKRDIKTKENKAQISNGSSTSTITAKNDSLASTSTSSSISYAIIIAGEKLDKYYDLLEFANDSKIEVRCKICLIYMACVERLIIDHMESKFHVENATKQKMDEYNKFLCYTDDAETKVTCEICGVDLPKVDRYIIEHMEDRNHEIAVTGLFQFHLITKSSSGYFCNCCEVHTTDYLEHINSKSHTNTFLQNYEIDKNEMRKYVYEDDINDLAARLHRELYKNLLKHNGIIKLNDTNYYCEMCQIKVGRISELDHVLGERHVSKLVEIENP